MQNNLKRPLPTFGVHDDGGEDAMGPRLPHDLVHWRFMAFKPATLALERLQDEGFKIAEMVIDDAIHFSSAGMVLRPDCSPA